ncbi:MAG TPA: PEP-CTERM sorting domain-containing protein [Tepidisphaeraceae bacterium]
MLNRKPLIGVKGVALSLWMIAGMTGIGASTARAVTVGLPANSTLSSLIALNGSGGVQIGNFIFSDFSFAPSSGNPTGNPAPTASQVTVTLAPGPNVGLTFNSAWQSVPLGFQDGNIRYAVQVTAGNVIDQVNLAFNGAAPLPSAGTVATVTESVATLLTTGSNVAVGPGTTIGQLATSNSVATGPTTTNNASLTLPTPQTGIYISKDILVTSGVTPPGIATISLVDNTYHSTAGGPIPEPASIGLLGAFGVGLLARRRRA